MKKLHIRIISTVIAVAISSVIVIALSYAGSATKMPIEIVLTNTGEMVKNMEEKLIVNKRVDTRAGMLNWFIPYTQNKQMLEQPAKILTGSYDNDSKESFERIISLEDSLKTTFPLISVYVAWGSKDENEFPATQVRNITQLGSIPVITWEPWLSEFSSEQYPGLRKPEDRDKNGLKDIANGMYDSYINQWVASVKKVNKPVYIRFGHEMNDTYHYPWGPQNNSAKDFIAAYQHVHDLFTKQGADKVIWIWSPHPAYEFKSFYPGDTYVDYVGVGALNYGSSAVWSKWWTFKEIFGNYYNQLASYNKPVMITEFGSLAKGGNRAKWYADALDSLPQLYPLVKSIIFFHFSNDNTTQQSLNWTIVNDHAVTGVIAGEFNKWSNL
jgi:hypothetical protein